MVHIKNTTPGPACPPGIGVSLHDHPLDLGHTPVVYGGHYTGGYLGDADSNGLALGRHQHHLSRAGNACARNEADAMTGIGLQRDTM
eukprot:1137998-Pelagomonas_calceolata.AAC.10